MTEFLSQEFQLFQNDYLVNNKCNDDNCHEELKGIISYLHDLTDFLKNYDDEPMAFTNMFSKFVVDHVIESQEGHRNIVFLGVICLKLFTRENWTGPSIDIDTLGVLGEILNSKELNDKSIDILEVNGDELYQLAKYPALLLIAYMILVESSNKWLLFTSLPLLSIRCLSVYCHVVDEAKEMHLSKFQSILDKADQNENGIKDLSKNIKADFYLCSFHLYLKFYNYNKASDYLDHVKKLLDIEVSLTASLGKRTKFQQKDLPQLKLDVKTGKNRDDMGRVTDTETNKDLPTDVLLDNDTLLPNITFIDNDTIKDLELSPIDQAYILSCCVYHQKTRPRDKLTSEELLPFLDAVLMSPQTWSVQLKALFLRCINEMSNSRKMERALTQLEAIVNTYKKPTPIFNERHPLIHAIDLNSQWMNERNHGQVAFAFGCVDTALEIFLRLQLWEDVILCYQRLGRHGEAETMIRKQLEKKESATLWCLLGDVTLDKQHYLKAWEFSKHRSARSQRSLGQWHLRKQEFKEAIPFFQKSLEINCLQPGIAFSLGCSSMAAKDIQLAAKSFQSCCTLDPDNHEAWCNLASNYIRLNQMQKAFKALLEATRLSYDNWKIWENFLLVATDVGAFEDSMRAVHRLIDLRRKNVDVEVLHILTKAIIEDIVDHRGVKASHFKPKMFKLFGHVTSLITSDPNVWELYAKLCLSEDSIQRKEQALDFLYKSHRCYTQNTVWEKNEKEVKHVMRVTSKMMEVTKSNCESSESKEKAVTWAYTTKMAISNLVIRLNKAYCDNEGNPFESIKSEIMQLQEFINETQGMISSYESAVCTNMC